MSLLADGEYARAWLAIAAVAIVGLTSAALAFPRRVYDGFIWRYFWGPVVADGRAATCAIRTDGSTVVAHSSSTCAAADGIVAYPGYTTVSTLSYGLVLIFMLLGVLILLDRLDVDMSPRFFYALFPYMLLGGALRVVEDLNATFLRADVAAPIPFPTSAAIISPLIYFVMFGFVLTILVGSLAISRLDLVDRYEYPLAGVGIISLVGTVGWLLYVGSDTDLVGFYPAVLIIVLVGATTIAGGFWILSQRYAPQINAGTGFMGALVVWGHSVDGIANVLSLDWADTLGLPVAYSSKHVVNQAIVDITGAVQPTWLSASIGTAWPFLLVKVAVAIAVVAIFDRTIFEESPRYTYLLLIAIIAIGLGPGTRDMLRATLGI